MQLPVFRIQRFQEGRAPQGCRGLTVAQAAERGSPLIFQIGVYATIDAVSDVWHVPPKPGNDAFDPMRDGTTLPVAV